MPHPLVAMFFEGLNLISLFCIGSFREHCCEHLIKTNTVELEKFSFKANCWRRATTDNGH